MMILLQSFKRQLVAALWDVQYLIELLLELLVKTTSYLGKTGKFCRLLDNNCTGCPIINRKIRNFQIIWPNSLKCLIKIVFIELLSSKVETHLEAKQYEF